MEKIPKAAHPGHLQEGERQSRSPDRLFGAALNCDVRTRLAWGLSAAQGVNTVWPRTQLPWSDTFPVLSMKQAAWTTPPSRRNTRSVSLPMASPPAWRTDNAVVGQRLGPPPASLTSARLHRVSRLIAQ